MFRTTNVYGMVEGFAVRVKDEREQDRNHLVEVSLELPLTFELADEILPAMARDLFQEGPNGWDPKAEMRESIFNLDPALQIMELRTHPELPADCRIAGVGLRKIKATKSEGGTWILKFTATWTLADPKEAILMIQRLKQGVYLSFEQQEPGLPLDDAALGATMEPKDVTPKKGRKKRGGTPETEAQRQLTEGQKLIGGGEVRPDEPGADGPADETTH